MVIIMLCVTVQLAVACNNTHSQFSTENSKNPNIVIMLLDDVGYGDIEPDGSIGYKTPNINKLAAQGMRFTNFYAQPVCSASRAALLTGCQPHRVSIYGSLFPHSNHGLNPKEETIEEMLKNRAMLQAW